MSSTLFTSLTLGSLTLANRIVMAPMTRSRAIGNVPNALMEGSTPTARRPGSSSPRAWRLLPTARGTRGPRPLQ